MDKTTIADQYLQALEARKRYENLYNKSQNDLESALQWSSEWRQLAQDLYGELMASFCWHCGAETTRHIDTYDVAQKYREYVMKVERESNLTNVDWNV